jgi:hypothetical protein
MATRPFAEELSASRGGHRACRCRGAPTLTVSSSSGWSVAPWAGSATSAARPGCAADDGELDRCDRRGVSRRCRWPDTRTSAAWFGRSPREPNASDSGRRPASARPCPRSTRRLMPAPSGRRGTRPARCLRSPRQTVPAVWYGPLRARDAPGVAVRIWSGRVRRLSAWTGVFGTPRRLSQRFADGYATGCPQLMQGRRHSGRGGGDSGRGDGNSVRGDGLEVGVVGVGLGWAPGADGVVGAYVASVPYVWAQLLPLSIECQELSLQNTELCLLTRKSSGRTATVSPLRPRMHYFHHPGIEIPTHLAQGRLAAGSTDTCSSPHPCSSTHAGGRRHRLGKP